MLNTDKPQGLFAIRMRIVELNLMHQRLLNQKPADGTWDWWIKKAVSELEADLVVLKENMAAPVGRHMTMQFENVFAPSISEWIQNGKGAQLQ